MADGFAAQLYKRHECGQWVIGRELLTSAFPVCAPRSLWLGANVVAPLATARPDAIIVKPKKRCRIRWHDRILEVVCTRPGSTTPRAGAIRRGRQGELLQRSTQRPADDTARVRVQDDGQEHELLAHSNI